MPILLAPMAGASPASLSIAVANAGSMGAMGALLTTPDGIREWVGAVRAGSPGPFQLNTWVPDPAPRRDADAEARVRAFLAQWGPDVPASAGDVTRPGIDEQCEAFLEARPAAVSSIMGLFAPRFVERFKADGIAWFATATTLAEATQAEAAGADAIIAQGFEAGGHRGAFDESRAERQAVGLFALIPRIADHVGVPIIATDFVKAAASADAPPPAPYPVQRGLTAAMKEAGAAAGDYHRMQVWAGQSAAMATQVPAGDLVRRIWEQARALLGSP